MGNFSQKDDMTRIGGFLHSPAEDEAPEKKPTDPGPQSPPPDPSSPWATPQAKASHPPPADPVPVAAPDSASPQQPPPPSFASPRPSASVPPPEPVSPPPASAPSAQPFSGMQAVATATEDNMWFVVDQATPPLEHPLREGRPVTLGRESNQDIVIMDKTLSRNHLILTRRGDRIDIQVLGLNGLVYAGQVYKSTNLEVNAPCALTLGNVACRIKKKVDTDATILMTDPAASARRQPQFGEMTEQQPAPAMPRSTPPVWPPPEDHGGIPGGVQSTPAPSHSPDFPSRDHGPRFPETPSAQSPPREYREPVFPSQAGSPLSPAASPPQMGRGDNHRQLLLIGGLGLAFLAIVGVALFLWLRQPAPPVPTGQPSAPPPRPRQEAIPEQVNRLHSQYLSKAKDYMAQGRSIEACDYLQDIPATSPLRGEAEELARQIPGCGL